MRIMKKKGVKLRTKELQTNVVNFILFLESIKNNRGSYPTQMFFDSIYNDNTNVTFFMVMDKEAKKLNIDSIEIFTIHRSTIKILKKHGYLDDIVEYPYTDKIVAKISLDNGYTNSVSVAAHMSLTTKLFSVASCFSRFIGNIHESRSAITNTMESTAIKF